MKLFWCVLFVFGFAAIYLVHRVFRGWLPRRTSYIIQLLLISGMIGGYGYLGDSRGLQQQIALQTTAKQMLTKLDTPEQLVQDLKNTLAKNPNSAEGWYWLGKIYFDMAHFKEAKEALGRAHALEPNNVDLHAQYCSSSYYANQMELDLQTSACLQKVLELEPNHSVAMNILALNAFRHKQYAEAKIYWQTLLNYAPQNSSERELLLKAIASAEEKSSLESGVVKSLGH